MNNKFNLKNNNYNKKGFSAIQVIFYIFMGIVFISIIIYGFNKIFEVEEQISEQERIQIKLDLTNAFNYCNDPLNRGNFKRIKLQSSLFNGVYLLGDNLLDSSFDDSNLPQDLKVVKEGGDNIVLFKSNFIVNNNKIEFNDFNIIDSFKIEEDFTFVSFFLDGDPNSQVGDTQRDGILIIEIKCDD